MKKKFRTQRSSGIAGLFLFAICFTAVAQVPGYLGMKNSFGYEPNFSVAYSYPNSHFNVSNLGFLGKYYAGRYTDPTSKFMALNLTHTLVYDRIVKRNASFNASFSFFKSGVSLTDLSTNYDPFTGMNTVYKGGLTKISGFAVNIAYRRYKNFLAPLGLYGGYFLGFGSSSAMVHTNTDTITFTKVRALTPKFGYVYGRQNVFFDNLIIDRGFSFDLFGFMLGFFSRNKSQNSVVATPAEHFQREIKTRMYYRDLVTFYIGGKYMF